MIDKTRTSIERIQPPSNTELLGVQDRPDYVRDPYSNAIFNLNQKEIDDYLDKKKMRQAQQNSEKRLDKMETDLDEIKFLLKELINK